MIAKKEREAFKKIFGNHYTDDVKAVLIKNEVKDTSNKTHSSTMIRQVFNGLRNHEEIELAIYKAAENKIISKKAIARKRNKILKSIN
jgi:hypothetical protein